MKILYLDMCTLCRPFDDQQQLRIMTTEAVLTEEQLVRQATDALIGKLGIAEATRFLSLKTRHRIESVEWHRKWQQGLDRDEFYKEVFRTLCREKADSGDKQ